MHCKYINHVEVHLWAGVIVCLGLQIHLLDEEVLEAAVTVQRLQQRRANLKGLHHTLQVGLVPCSFALSYSLLYTVVCDSSSHAT